MKDILICTLRMLEPLVLKKIIEQDTIFFSPPWTRESWESSVGNDSYQVAYLIEGHELIAWALFQQSEGECLIHLLKIYVTPNYRHCGIGRKILNSMSEFGRTKSIHRFYLEVSKTNDSAISFYLAQGFKILHEIKSFYADGSNALIMELNY